MRGLSGNWKRESEGLLSYRGLRPEIKNQEEKQVFEMFYSGRFAQRIFDIENEIRVETRICSFAGSVDELPERVLENYVGINAFFKEFFGGASEEHKWDVVDLALQEMILGVTPLSQDVTRFTVLGDGGYRCTLLAGVEWLIFLMSAALFGVIDASAQSPSLAAFIVYIVDQFLLWIYARVSQRTLGSSALIDRRFILIQ
jgi:hypothetical protein